MKIKGLYIRTVTFYTPMSPAETLKELADVLTEKDPEKLSYWDFSVEKKKKFEGRIKDNTFHIIRYISYRSSWNPEIKGRVSACNMGSEITLHVGTHPFVQVFSYLFLLITGFMCCVLLLAANASDASLGSVIPFILFILMLALSLGSFRVEAKNSIRSLSEIWDVKS
jgi:ABC-type multidrug transport system fused ATPase/permease subunit